MKNERLIHHLLRILLLILGGALGIALVNLLLPMIRRHIPSMVTPIWRQYILSAGAALIGVGLMVIFSERLISGISQYMTRMERRLDAMAGRQIMLTVSGLVLGLLVAALFTVPVLRAGVTLLSLTLTAIFYVLLGYLGARMGNHRYKRNIAKKFRNRHKNRSAASVDDTVSLFEMMIDDEAEEQLSEADADGETDDAPAAQTVRPKVLDSSVLIGGRLTTLYQCGIPEGRLIVPGFVVTEMQKLSDSADDERRRRGRRGLTQLKALQDAGAPVEIQDVPLSADEAVDTALVRLCVRIGGVLVTDDANLCKVAEIAGVPVLSLTRVLNALRAAFAAGDSVQVSISREGKEPGQGVGYLEDGTMLVVDGARAHVGKAVNAVVTSVLQTAAGRMVFARMQDEAEG